MRLEQLTGGPVPQGDRRRGIDAETEESLEHLAAGGQELDDFHSSPRPLRKCESYWFLIVDSFKGDAH